MMKEEETTAIFENDEMRLRTVSGYWDSEDLLKQEAMFFLKDVVAVLDLDSAKVKTHIRGLRKRGHENLTRPWARVESGATGWCA